MPKPATIVPDVQGLTVLSNCSKHNDRYKNAPGRRRWLVYVTLFVDGILMGYIGTLYEKMMPSAFWWFNTGISLVGAVLVLLFGRAITHGLSRKTSTGAAVPDQVSVAVA